MTTKRALLLLITIFACVSLVEAQSPNPSPSASPEASASPAKKRGRKKAETSPSPSVSPEASASPAKTRGHKKTEASPSPTTSPMASASPAEHQARKKASPAPATESSSTAVNATPAPGGGHGMVWVNTDSHIYHKEGSRHYGKTKQGKYMSEADAIKEGDRPAKKE